jgi:predicted site-specific integrase-resolvase
MFTLESMTGNRPALISIREAAAILGVSYSRAHALVRDGRLRRVGSFAGAALLDRSSVESFERRKGGRPSKNACSEA